MRTIAFDLDGTLADTSADLLAAANACFDAIGRPAPLAAADTVTAFLGGRAMLRLGSDRLGLGWDEAEIGRQYAQLLGHYEAVIDRETRLYPGAGAALDRLLSSGARLAICTNKPAGWPTCCCGGWGCATGSRIWWAATPSRCASPTRCRCAPRWRGPGVPPRAAA